MAILFLQNGDNLLLQNGDPLLLQEPISGTSVPVFQDDEDDIPMFLRQSTASQEILLGPFRDSIDGVTAETGLTIANTDIKLWKGGSTTEVNKNSGGGTHTASGRYSAVLDDTDTNTVGMLEVHVAVSGALPVRRSYYVLEEAIYDAMFAASAAGYQVPIWAAANSTVNLSGTTVKTLTDGATLADGAITAAKIASDAITAAKVASDAVTEIQSGLATSASIAALSSNAFAATSLVIGTVESQTSFLLTGGPANDIANVIAIIFDTSASNSPVYAEGSYAGTAGRLTLTAATAITVTSSDTVTLVYSGSQSAAVNVTQIAGQTVTASAGVTFPASIASATTVAAIETDTQDIQSRLPAALVSGRMDSSVGAMASGVITAAAIATGAIDADAIASDAVTEIQSGLATSAALDTVDNFLDTEIAAIKAVTDKLDTAMELDSTVYRFTVNALEQAPAGGGGGSTDWTADEKTAIKTILGIPATGTTPEAPSAGALKVIDDFIDTEAAAIVSAVAAIEADTQDIQSRLPAALVSGRMDSSVGAMASGVVTASAVATGAIDADALATDAVSEIADGILSRSVSNVESSAGEHTLCTVVLAMLENSISGTTLTIKRTDGSTTHVSKTLTTNASANPITGIS